MTINFYRPTKPIPVPYVDGDELIHTDDYPFCSDVSCPCHDIQDGQYYQLIARPLLDGLMTAEEANRLYFGDNPLDLPSYEQASQPTPIDYDELERETGTHPWNCRCSWCEPQERNATMQTESGEWW